MTTKTTGTTTPRPLRAPPARLTERQVCVTCANLDTSDTLAMGEGVGWCRQHSQYRALRIERECNDFCSRSTK